MDDLTRHVLQRSPQGESLKLVMMLHSLSDLSALARYLQMSPQDFTRRLQDGTLPTRPPGRS